jgi:hypothetical protein
MQRQKQKTRPHPAQDLCPHRPAGQKSCRSQNPLIGVDPPESQHECQQIDPQGDGPQQGHRRHVGGQQSGDRHQQARRQKSQPRPAPTLSPGNSPIPQSSAGSLGIRPTFLWLGNAVATEQQTHPAQQHQGCHQRVGSRPQESLPSQRQTRLQYQRVPQQPAQAAGIAGHIEKIGIQSLPLPRDPSCRQPPLQQRRRRRQEKQRHPSSQSQVCQQSERGPPSFRLAGDPQLKGQKPQPDQQQDPVDQHPHPGIEAAPQPICPQVAQKQGGLKKGQAGIPHQGGSPPQRQQQLAHQQLSPEEAKSATKQAEAN